MSQPSTPSYGPPPPPPYAAPVPPPPPWKPRPSGWWFVLGGGLVLAGLAIGVGLFVWTLRGFLETDATVPADGRQHAVAVGAGDRVLWDHPADPADCRIADSATGEEVSYAAVDGSFTRSDGSGEWVAERRFGPGSGDLRVMCAPTGGPARIGPAPDLGTFIGGIFATILVPLLLGALGLVVLIVTGVRFATGGPRRPQPPSGAGPGPTST